VDESVSEEAEAVWAVLGAGGTVPSQDLRAWSSERVEESNVAWRP